MKITARLALFAAAAAAAVWLWIVFFPGPEKIIRRHLASVAADVSFSSGQNALVMANNVENLGGFFATNVEVNVDVPGHERQTFASRAEITQAALAAHQAVRGLQVQFLDVSVTLAPDRQSATADLTVKAQAAGEKDFYSQELKITFRKMDGDWFITRVETVRTLS